MLLFESVHAPNSAIIRDPFFDGGKHAFQGWLPSFLPLPTIFLLAKQRSSNTAEAVG